MKILSFVGLPERGDKITYFNLLLDLPCGEDDKTVRNTYLGLIPNLINKYIPEKLLLSLKKLIEIMDLKTYTELGTLKDKTLVLAVVRDYVNLEKLSRYVEDEYR